MSAHPLMSVSSNRRMTMPERAVLKRQIAEGHRQQAAALAAAAVRLDAEADLLDAGTDPHREAGR